MIQGKRILAVIPARGGSKGFVRKNAALLMGKPLIEWSWLAAKESKYIDQIYLSTDDLGLQSLAQSFGLEAQVLRPPHLSTDEAKSADVILHALDVYPGFDYVMMLQPTSPLRTSEDIDTCIEKCVVEKNVACISLTPADKPPHWMYTVSETGHLVSFLNSSTGSIASDMKQFHQRQALPKVTVLNGAVYIAETLWFKSHQTFISKQTAGYIMPKERSVDIDTEIDLEICELLIKKASASRLNS
jgi:CMP-N,N'-diacetyllegionaminic acid synthase